jgi:hypothetical protein
MGLSSVVAAAVPEAIATVERLAVELLATVPIPAARRAGSEGGI